VTKSDPEKKRKLSEILQDVGEVLAALKKAEARRDEFLRECLSNANFSGLPIEQKKQPTP
jgi:hypothetical protein